MLLNRKTQSEIYDSIWACTRQYVNLIRRVKKSDSSITEFSSIPNPEKMVFDGNHIWVSSGENTLYKMSRDGSVIDSVSGLSRFYSMVAGNGCIWLGGGPITGPGGYVIKVYPSMATEQFPISKYAFEMAFDGINIWVTHHTYMGITKVDPAGNATLYPTGLVDPTGIAFDGTDMVFTCYVNGAIYKISSSGTLTYRGFLTYPSSVSFDGTNMWIVSEGSKVTKLTPGGSTTTYTGLLSAGEIIFDGTSLWTCNQSLNGLSKISLSGSIQNISTGTPCNGIAYDGALLSHWWGGS